MIKRILIGAFLVIMLCGAKCTKEDHNIGSIVIDPSLKQRCPSLPVVDVSEAMKMGTLYLEYSKLQSQYIECAIRNDCLIEATDDTTKITCPAIDKVRENTNG